MTVPANYGTVYRIDIFLTVFKKEIPQISIKNFDAVHIIIRFGGQNLNLWLLLTIPKERVSITEW